MLRLHLPSSSLSTSFIRPLALVRTARPPSQPTVRSNLDTEFTLFPSFFTPAETRVLLSAALWKLDSADGVRRRLSRRRSRLANSSRSSDSVKEQASSPSSSASNVQQTESSESVSVEPGSRVFAALQDMFDTENQYGFEEGHFDSVIHYYRENLITTLPSDPLLPPLLSRLHDLLPNSTSAAPSTPNPSPSPTQSSPSLAPDPTSVMRPGSTTHALHLAPRGEILAHVDNIEASGGSIVGASLGAARILRLERKGSEGGGGDGEGGEGWDVLLPSGSVYVQSGRVRYEYAHSILPYDHESSQWDGQRLQRGHRVSLMVRVLFSMIQFARDDLLCSIRMGSRLHNQEAVRLEEVA